MKFKLVEDTFIQQEMLNESLSLISKIINNLSNTKYKNPSFWKQHKNLYNALCNISDFNLNEYDVHHISGVHDNRIMHSSNVDIHNLALINRKLHTDVTSQNKKIVDSFIKDYISSLKIDSLDARLLTTLIVKDEDIIQNMILLSELLIKHKINPNEVFCVDVRELQRIIDDIPQKLSLKFIDIYKEHPKGILFFKTLLSEYPELQKAFNKDIGVDETK